MVQRYLEVLYDPDAFYERGEEAGSLIGPVVALLVVGVVSAAAVFLSFQQTAELMSRMDLPGGGQMESVMGISSAITMFFALVGPFVGWLVWGGLFHGISAFLDGEGEFTTTMVYVGWGTLPSVLGALVNAGATWAALQTVSLPSGEVTRQSLQAYQQSMQTATPTVVGALFSIVVLLWSAYIWVSAVQYARDVDREDALIAVGIPVAILLLVRLYSNFNVFL